MSVSHHHIRIRPSFAVKREIRIIQSMPSPSPITRLTSFNAMIGSCALTDDTTLVPKRRNTNKNMQSLDIAARTIGDTPLHHLIITPRLISCASFADVMMCTGFCESINLLVNSHSWLMHNIMIFQL